MFNRLRGGVPALGRSRSAAAVDRLVGRFGPDLERASTAPNIVVLGDPGVAARLAERFPGRHVHLVASGADDGHPPGVDAHRADDLAAMHGVLRLIPRIGVLVDGLPDTGGQSDRLRELLFHVWSSGAYVLLDTAPETRALLDELDRIRADPGFSANAEASVKKVGAIAEFEPAGVVATHRLAAAVGGRARDDDVTVLHKRLLHFWKVREEDMGREFIAARMRSWTTEQVVIPARRTTPRATLTTNRPDLVAGYFPAEFDVPALALRSYDAVICAQRQIVARANLLLPDTFRLIRRPYLKHDILQDVDARFARIPGSLKDLPTLAGSYYYLDSEYPATFGHLMTDMIGRLWAWERVLAAVPDVKLLVSARKSDHGVIPEWMRSLLNAYGIPDERIEVLDRTAIVERLWAVTPQYVNFTYVAPEVRIVWDALRDRLLDAAGDAPTPRRIFVSRTRGGSRDCRNADEVEALFERAGYTVVLPERYDLPTQAAIFARAERIAGFGGSGMLNTIFSTGPRRVLVLQPETHAAVNEYLIASVFGDDIEYVYSAAELAEAPDVSARDRYQSPYTVDLAADGDRLRAFAAT